MTLVLALILEWVIGDPQNRWHPVAVFGRWAAWVEDRLHRNDYTGGAAAWLLAIGLPLLLTTCMHLGFWKWHPVCGVGFDALLIWVSIGWKSLIQHVRAVLTAHTLQMARSSVGRIVGRDTQHMELADVRRSALESLAENASDAVVAPLFWYAVGGPLAATVYRMVNTLDAMWGHRNEHYRQFGWWAARADDVANWIPARITAMLYLLMARIRPSATMQQQARQHPSLNAGWPEVALAYAAEVRLGGPVRRAGMPEDRPWMGPDAGVPADDRCMRALQLTQTVLWVWAMMVMGVCLA